VNYMDVRLSNILHSAEKLVRDQEFSRSTPPAPLREGNPGEVRDTVEFSNLLTGKFQTVQAKLAELQSSYSKEQMRLSYLADPNSRDASDLIHVLFGKEPLFPEFQSNPNVDLDQLRKASELRLSELEAEIRHREVENENVIALGSQDKNLIFSDLIKGIDSVTWKPLNEKVVQRLIES